jgi:hypothetical protein
MEKRTLNWMLPFVIAVSFASALPAIAETFKLEKGVVKFDVPRGWDSAEGLYGMPLTLLGEEKEGKRAVILVTPTGVNGVSFDGQALAKESKDYENGRRRWVASVGGNATNFRKYASAAWPGAQEVHTFGFDYELNGQKYSENSYYVVCNGSLYHLKSVVPGSVAEQSSSLEKSLRSFSCK